MFEDNQQLYYDKLYSRYISKSFREMSASTIYSALTISRDFVLQHPSLPRTNYYWAAYNVQFIIPNIMMKIIEDQDHKFLNVYGDEAPNPHGRPYVEFEINNIKVHIKKNRNAEKLPNISIYRESESTKNNMQMALDFGTDTAVSQKLFAIITYNHQRFNLKYIQIGFPKDDYSGWIDKWSLIDDIKSDTVEMIKKKYGPEIREEIANNITKKYGFGLRA